MELRGSPLLLCFLGMYIYCELPNKLVILIYQQKKNKTIPFLSIVSNWHSQRQWDGHSYRKSSLWIPFFIKISLLKLLFLTLNKCRSQMTQYSNNRLLKTKKCCVNLRLLHLSLPRSAKDSLPQENFFYLGLCWTKTLENEAVIQKRGLLLHSIFN